jgi:hypothetical protein
MTDKNDGLDPTATVLGCRFVGERRPGHEVRDSDLDTLRTQFFRNIVQAQRENIEHAAKEVNVGVRRRRRAGRGADGTRGEHN